MQADTSDAPEWVTRRKNKPKHVWAIALLISTAVGIGIALAMSHETQKRAEMAAKTLFDRLPRQKTEASALEIKRERLEQQLENAQTYQLAPAPAPEPTAEPQAKQTVFNDSNYTPKPAYNVVSNNDFFPKTAPAQPEPVQTGIAVNVVTPKAEGEWVCNHLYKSGSLENRACNRRIDLDQRHRR